MSRNNEPDVPSLYDLLEASMELDKKILQYLRHSDERRNQVFSLLLNTKPVSPATATTPSSSSAAAAAATATAPTANPFTESLDGHVNELLRQRFPEKTGESSRPHVVRARSTARPLRGNLEVVPDLMNLPELPKITKSHGPRRKKERPRYEYTDTNRDIQEIEETPDDPIPIRDKLVILVASLLSQSLDRNVDMEEDIVLEAVDKMFEVANITEGEMLNCYFRKKQIPRLQALKTPWDVIYKSIRTKYAIILERKVERDFNLEIGRCDNMWAASGLLKHVVDTRLNINGLQAISSLQEYENMMGIEQDSKPTISERSTSHKVPPPPIVIPASNDDSGSSHSSSHSSNDDEEDGDEREKVSRKRLRESDTSSSSSKKRGVTVSSSTVYYNEED
ncbi:uncharacterized protein EV154DRAFT_528938 [Mucor mucedo]|uniref:uncharacterized protein n=1 Tax=Mucor mucedo TaxID=29922 RepID=UPI00221E5CFC|nr:uncharacterized protein EV154DRAFT_528938 [Mucor mucedo]KAI7873080.1 hypothetical protein EV154DRAFT_528938 [Mucor mucedo]